MARLKKKKKTGLKRSKKSASVQRKALKDPQKTWRMTAQVHFKHKSESPQSLLQNKNKLSGGSGLLYSTVDIRYKNLETRVAKVCTQYIHTQKKKKQKDCTVRLKSAFAIDILDAS